MALFDTFFILKTSCFGEAVTTQLIPHVLAFGSDRMLSGYIVI